MAREFTVILKQPEAGPPSTGKRMLDALNDVVKSPLFVFVFGASLATFYPALKEMATPAAQLDAQRAEEHARADAALVAPFLANLSTTEKGKFQAARAALKALEDSADKDGKNGARPMFVAVNRAIDAVALQLWPPTEKAGLTAEVTQSIDRSAQAAPAVTDSTISSYRLLQSALVYIQVDRSNAPQVELANKMMLTLRANSVVSPGIEKLANTTMPKKTQIRYFHDSDRGKAEALAGIVKQVTGLQVFLAKPDLTASEGTLEIWFERAKI